MNPVTDNRSVTILYTDNLKMSSSKVQCLLRPGTTVLLYVPVSFYQLPSTSGNYVQIFPPWLTSPVCHNIHTSKMFTPIHYV